MIFCYLHKNTLMNTEMLSAHQGISVFRFHTRRII